MCCFFVSLRHHGLIQIEQRHWNWDWDVMAFRGHTGALPELGLMTTPGIPWPLVGVAGPPAPPCPPTPPMPDCEGMKGPPLGAALGVP